MAYSSNYYNYQVAVIFAILLGALILLGVVVCGLYYGFVANVGSGRKSANLTSNVSVLNLERFC